MVPDLDLVERQLEEEIENLEAVNVLLQRDLHETRLPQLSPVRQRRRQRQRFVPTTPQLATETPQLAAVPPQLVASDSVNASPIPAALLPKAPASKIPVSTLPPPQKTTKCIFDFKPRRKIFSMFKKKTHFAILDSKSLTQNESNYLCEVFFQLHLDAKHIFIMGKMERRAFFLNVLGNSKILDNFYCDFKIFCQDTFERTCKQLFGGLSGRRFLKKKGILKTKL